jgi:molybdate transport system substrate-binding protein
MRKSSLVSIALSVFLVCAPVAHAAPDGEAVKIFVAASTKEVVDTIAKQFQAETGTVVEVSPGPSSKLSKQIVEGGPADLFLSADQANADYLAEKDLVAQRRNLLGNRLVVVVPADSPIKIDKLEDLARDAVKQLALALEKVPAGEYARQALKKAGVWQRVEGKIVGGEDVRATLAFVERGASAGIVYFTDPIGDSKVRVALEIGPDLHRPIEYLLVLIKREPANPAAVKL